MSKVEGGVRSPPPPSRPCVTIFSRKLLGLNLLLLIMNNMTWPESGYEVASFLKVTINTMQAEVLYFCICGYEHA